MSFLLTCLLLSKPGIYIGVVRGEDTANESTKKFEGESWVIGEIAQSAGNVISFPSSDPLTSDRN